MQEERAYDVVLWGATGYTGRFAFEHASRLAAAGKLSFAVGGRNEAALAALIERGVATHGYKAGCLVATLDDAAALQSMCEQTRVLCSFAGPFADCGEPVVKACVAAGTHYVDITAEVSWVQQMIARYGEAAEAKHLKLVPCCGFDYVPNDMMFLQLAEYVESTKGKWGNLATDLDNVVQTFSQSTPMVSGGTALSAVTMLKALGFRNAFNWYLNPHVLCARQNADLRKHNLVVPKHVTENEYCAKFLMTNLANKYVHWMNEKSGYAFGENLVYYPGESRKHVVWATLCSFAMWLGFLSLWIASLVPLQYLRRVLPQPGNGPAATKDSFMYSNLIANFKNGGRLSFKWRLLAGESYVFTGISAVTAGMLLARGDGLPNNYGFQPPSRALGKPFLDALANVGGLEMAAPEANSAPAEELVAETQAPSPVGVDEEIASPDEEPSANAAESPSTNPSTDPMMDPMADSTADLMADPATNHTTDHTTDPTEHPIEEPKTEDASAAPAANSAGTEQ